MIKKLAIFISFALWIALLLIVIFADPLGISIQPRHGEPTTLGIYQIGGIIIMAVGVISSIIQVFSEGMIKLTRKDTS